MNANAFLAALSLALFSSSVAFAQDADPAPAAAPESAPSASPAPEAAPAQRLSCGLGSHAGIDEADATTASRLVCNEVARAGAPAGAHYRVDIGKLGATVILSVAREGDTPGSTADSRELRLQGIEEVSVAAPRLGQAIVRGAPVAETETTENLVGEETRKPKTKPGSVHAALGLIGMLPPLDQGLAPAAGLSFDVHYEANRVELGAGLRGGGNSSSTDPSMAFFQASIGGRYYLADTDFAPYVGGGLQWMFLNLNVPSENFSGNNGGLGAYADAGVEILRTHHTHLAFGARLDLPFFEIDNSNSEYNGPTYGYSGSSAPVTTTTKTYYAPLSLEVRLTF
jgi:hypothetical protein